MASMIHRLHRIVQDVNRASDIGQALDLILGSVTDDLSADACTIFLAGKEDPELMVLKGSVGLNPGIVDTVERHFEQGLVGKIASRAEPINLVSAPDHKHFLLMPDSGEAEFPVFLGVPIIAHRKVLGVLAVQRSKVGFNADEEAFLTTLASQLATSIERAESQGRISAVEISQRVQGVAGSPGLAIGVAVVLNRGVNLDSVPNKKIDDVEGELKSFDDAVEKVCGELNQQAEIMRASLPEEECALFLAYAQMLSRGSLIDDTTRRIRTGNWAAASWRDTVEQHARAFEKMEDRYLAERASDVRDLGVRVLRKLMLEQSAGLDFPDDTILVGNEVTASDLADVPSERLSGIVSAHGSSSSHVAILAHALGIPAVMGANNLPIKQLDGVHLVVDGYNGSAFINPGEALLDEYRQYRREEEAIEEELLEIKNLPAVTLDQHRVSLLVNTGLMSDYTPSLRIGAEGVGLYRTEIPFQIRDRFPSEKEQYLIYKNVLETFKGMPVVLRTLDVGGDKPLSYFPIHEANPFLGWRGVRITLDHPEIFVTQVRAMIRANVDLNNLEILLPMISSKSELMESMVLIRRVRDEIEEECERKLALPKIGAMIEVPSAVYQIEDFCEIVDFVSIGTNDLTQYLLAVDRNNESVADLFSSLHPAVLKAMKQIVEGAAKSRTPVSVCGELAGDPLGVMALLGMGIDSLSMSVGSLLRAKKVILSFSRQELTEIFDTAVAMPEAIMIRNLYATRLEERGLGGFLRAGR